MLVCQLFETHNSVNTEKADPMRPETHSGCDQKILLFILKSAKITVSLFLSIFVIQNNMAKSAAALGFDLDELDGAVTGYERPSTSAQNTAESSQTLGRPRTLANDAQPVSIRLDAAQRRWLLEEAARRTLASGKRHDVSRLVRELIDQARRASK